MTMQTYDQYTFIFYTIRSFFCKTMYEVKAAA